MSTEFSSVAIIDGAVWAGNADGLVWSRDNGKSWDVFRTAAPGAYAYPSPFSPLIESGQPLRVHYKPDKAGRVTIKIYDFAMNLVTTLFEDNPAVGEYQDSPAWDGRNDKGDMVANGVYFFKVEASGGQVEWGKLVVLK